MLAKKPRPDRILPLGRGSLGGLMIRQGDFDRCGF